MRTPASPRKKALEFTVEFVKGANKRKKERMEWGGLLQQNYCFQLNYPHNRDHIKPQVTCKTEVIIINV
jgi:hypothetical protein